MQVAGTTGLDSPAGAPATAVLSASPATILIVDDEPSNRKLLEATLRRDSYAVVAAANGEAALAAIARHAPDLILLDIKLPGIDGYQVARALKGDPGTSNIPIIMVTMLVDRDARMAALKAGVEEFVTKPIDPGELLLRVRNLLRLKAYGDLLENHSAMLELKVQARTADLRESEQRLRAIFDTDPECVKVVNKDMVLLDMNPAGLAMLEAGSLAEVQAQPLADFIVPEYRAAFAALHERVMHGESDVLEFQVVGLKGGRLWLETHAAPLDGRNGKAAILLGITRDITARKAAEARIIRLNRVYAVLSGINSAIVRIRERNELFRETCRIAVSKGGFVLARVIEVDADGKASIATSTESDSRLFQSIVDGYNRDPERSASMLRTALRDRQPLFSNNVADDPRIPYRAALTSGGNYAVAVLPIHAGDRFVGSLILRAQSADAFDTEEKLLLLELTGNISFALAHIEQEERLAVLSAGQVRDQEELRRFGAAMDATADAIYLVDRESMRFVHVNEAACRMRNQTREELLALGPAELLGSSQEELGRSYDAIIAGGVDAEPVERQRTRKDGSQVCLELRRHAVRLEDRWTIVTLVRDVTERRRAAQELLESEARFRSLSTLSSDWFWEQDAEHRFVEFSGGDNVKGWGPDQRKAIGMRRWELPTIVPLDGDWAAHKAALDAHEPFRNFEYRRYLEDGSLQYVAASGEPLFDLDGRFTGYRGVATEITQRKQAEFRIKRLNRVHAVLSGINTLIVRTLDRAELFREACRIAVSAGEFRLAWIATLDDDATQLRMAAWDGAGHDYVERMPLSLDESDGDRFGLAGRVVRDKQPLVVEDMSQDPRVFLRSRARKKGFHSLAMLPLVVSDAVVGVLALYAAEVGFFNDDELKLLSELAGDIAFSIHHIERAGRLARTTRVNAMLSDINGAIVRIRGRKALFEEACRVAVETGGLPFAWVGVVNSSATRLRLVASAGRDDGFLETIRNRLAMRGDTPDTESLSWRAIRERRAVVVNDVAADTVLRSRKAFADRGINSVAVFPLVIADRVAGAFALHSEQAGFFDHDEMRLLDEVAANIAFALEHIEKEEKVQRLTRVYAVLSGINALIVRARDRGELFSESCRIGVESGDFAKVWIGTIEPATRRFTMVASHGGDPQFFPALEAELAVKLLAGEGLAARAFSTLQPVVVNDARSDPDVLLKDGVMASGVRSIAILPLVVSGTAMGVLALNSGTPGFFDEEEVTLLAELARNIAFAVDHIGKQDKLDYLAYYDELTGLANRRLFLERVAPLMRAAVSGGHKLALFFVDLERFRNITDSLGRPAGDSILKQMAEWLMHNVGDASLLARVGPDQFAVVLPEVKQEGNLAGLLEKASRALLNYPFRANDAEIRIATKTGVALFPNDGIDADTLLKNAEAALKKAKAGGERYLFYQEKMTDRAAGKLTLENQLREALDKEEFVLHYQPKVSLESGKLTSAEALIRWNNPRTGMVPPGQFIPILEETGLIYDVGRWALRKAIEDYLRWRAAGLPAVRIAVNVSPLQLRNRGFSAEIQQVVGIDPLAAAGLELEITESVIMEDVKSSIASLEAIRAMGVTIAIDDFGTGFSSLSHLAKLPVDTLKIDRSFVIDMTAGPDGLALVSTIINLAHSFRLKVVAEGVETEEQSRLLRLMRCDEMQGFLFSRPVPAEVFEMKFLGPPEVVH